MEAVRQRAGSLHGLLFLAVVSVVAFGFPPPSWPWYLFLPLLGYVIIVLAFPPLRRTAPLLSVGRLGGAPLACAAALAVLTSGVLLGFHALIRPDVIELGARLPVAAFGNIVLAGVCFSVVNAALEELIFRGVLWEVVADEWNPGLALLVTSALFGIGHLQGYPPGPLGAGLAGLYGVALGLLRWWAGGLGLTVACHVCADATIFGILLWSGVVG